ncbi:protein TOPLESS-RELATED PROTEIN 2-like [Dioscorea cayenensis subsp. rotundata]|uniref:Protein TOPLESS-RELATED PROTEIN 2-like n=1 Tax=Dioscorea cayennensis subsp. rotundata TaxID=55577 RepID=A0AB40BU30_DIOCR|nr:protein TOPLESS-RELATED PROTEIN 2-like [Dioscorea cayenensis subsp. rotundata]
MTSAALMFFPSAATLMFLLDTSINLRLADAPPKTPPMIFAHTRMMISINSVLLQVMTAFMAPPPAATYLAFHPQDNNIIAIGTDDSSIQIYNVRIDEVKTKLKGHQKKITGLVFSQMMNVLVSSRADAQ